MSRKNRRGNVRNADSVSPGQSQGSQGVQKPTEHSVQSKANTGHEYAKLALVQTPAHASSSSKPQISQPVQQPKPTESRGQSGGDTTPKGGPPKLELPHGYIAPSKKPTGHRRRGKPNDTAKNQTPKLELPEGYVPPNKNPEGPGKSSEYQKMLDYSRLVKPWALDPRYVSTNHPCPRHGQRH